MSFDGGELTIRDGKGGKDRVTMLPVAMRGRLNCQPIFNNAASTRRAFDAGQLLKRPET